MAAKTNLRCPTQQGWYLFKFWQQNEEGFFFLHILSRHKKKTGWVNLMTRDYLRSNEMLIGENNWQLFQGALKDLKGSAEQNGFPCLVLSMIQIFGRTARAYPPSNRYRQTSGVLHLQQQSLSHPALVVEAQTFMKRITVVFGPGC